MHQSQPHVGTHTRTHACAGPAFLQPRVPVRFASESDFGAPGKPAHSLASMFPLTGPGPVPTSPLRARARPLRLTLAPRSHSAQPPEPKTFPRSKVFFGPDEAVKAGCLPMRKVSNAWSSVKCLSDDGLGGPGRKRKKEQALFCFELLLYIASYKVNWQSRIINVSRSEIRAGRDFMKEKWILLKRLSI